MNVLQTVLAVQVVYFLFVVGWIFWLEDKWQAMETAKWGSRKEGAE